MIAALLLLGTLQDTTDAEFQIGTVIRFRIQPQESAEKARQLFVEVERLNRKSVKHQKDVVPRLYGQLIPALRSLDDVNSNDSHIHYLTKRQPGEDYVSAAARLRKEEEELEPEELLKRGLQAGCPWRCFRDRAMDRALSLIRRYPDLLDPLLLEDLKSEGKTRALYTIKGARLRKYASNVLSIFRSDKKLAGLAANTLGALGEWNAIPALIERHPGKPMTYSLVLQNLSQARPPHPSLLRLLDSDETEVRHSAAWALSRSGDRGVIPLVRRLVKDSDPQMRRYAVEMAFSLKNPEYARVEKDVQSLLSDPSREVRWRVTYLLAFRKDSVVARTLLDFVQDNSMDYLEHSQVVESIRKLTGKTFGYSENADRWQPTLPENRAAIQRFEGWIKENAKPRDR